MNGPATTGHQRLGHQHSGDHRWRVLAGRLLLLVLAASLLSACGLFGRKDEEARPAELVDFETTLNVQRIWNANTGAGLSRSAPRLKPFFANGRVWVMDARGRVTAIDAETGRTALRHDADMKPSAGPGVYGNNLFFGTFDGELVRMDATDGRIVWRAQLSSEILSLPVVQDNVVIARCIDGRVFGINLDTGRRLWVNDRSVPLLTLRGTSDPLIRAGQVYIGHDDGTVVGMRVADGSPLWEQRVSVPEGRSELDRLADIDGPMVIVGADLYAVTRHGRMASLAVDTGRIQWIKDVASHSGLSVSRTRLAAADVDDAVWLVDRQSGSTLWRDDRLARRGVTRPEFYGDFLVVADREGYLHWIDAESGEFAARVRASRNAPAGAPLVVGTTLYLLDEDGGLTAWRAGAAL